MKIEEKAKWYFSPIGAVLLLFFVLGPFALPILYKSPNFSRKSKIILTVAITIYTVYLISASVDIGRTLYKQIAGS